MTLLIDKHAVHFDTALRDQVVARYQTLGLPTYWAGINAQLSTRIGSDGAVESVQLSYPTSTEQQYLGYGEMFDGSLRTPHQRESTLSPASHQPIHASRP